LTLFRRGFSVSMHIKLLKQLYSFCLHHAFIYRILLKAQNTPISPKFIILRAKNNFLDLSKRKGMSTHDTRFHSDIYHRFSQDQRISDFTYAVDFTMSCGVFSVI
jgi:hypothetical protein